MNGIKNNVIPVGIFSGVIIWSYLLVCLATRAALISGFGQQTI